MDQETIKKLLLRCIGAYFNKNQTALGLALLDLLAAIYFDFEHE